MPDYQLDLTLEERDTVVHALRHMAIIAVEACPSFATAIAQVEGINDLLGRLGAEPEKVPTE